MSKNNQRYYKEPIQEVQEEPIAVEAPIEEAPIAIEEPVEEVLIEEKEEKVEEFIVEEKIEEPKFEEPKKENKPTKKIIGTVLLITRDGCIVSTKEKGNLSLYGKQYMALKIGDTVEL